MKEYRTINDLSKSLKKELNDNASFFDNIDGKSLDEQQRIACVLNDCDLEIIAGAGTGKTQTLIAKSNYLIEKKNIEPSEILCLSFSNSSVDDLKKRLKHPIETRTIHSLGLSIIKKFEKVNVLDEDYGFNMIFKEYLENASEKELDDIKYLCENYLANTETKIKLNEIDSEEEKINFLISKTKFRIKCNEFIELFKGKDKDLSDFNALKKSCEKEFQANRNSVTIKNVNFIRVIDPIFRYYQGYLDKNHMVDYSDMVNKGIRYVKEKDLSLDYKYIFVDEYQDMSFKNFELVKSIKDRCNANLVVVGDDWQSIYGFRDSDLSLFTDFDDYFPNANRVFIEKTYRSSQQLIDVAGKFIMKNKNQFKKSLESDLSINNPLKIVYHSFNTEKEKNTIYNLIYNLSSKKNDVLILGRHNKDIDEFLFNTKLVKKGRSKNHKKITDKTGTIENVEFRSIHKAKGLEADYVIIIKVIDDGMGFPNKLPNQFYRDLIHEWSEKDKIEEERRLFYVALTRAKKCAYIFTIKNKESKYIQELRMDNASNLEIIYTNDEGTYSHLKEFDKAPEIKPKKKTRKSRIIESKSSNVNKNGTKKVNLKQPVGNIGDSIDSKSKSNLKNTENLNKVSNRNSKNNIITVSKINFTKLLGSKVGDKIIVNHYYNRFDPFTLKITGIDNPKGQVNTNSNGNVNINVTDDSFKVIKNCGHGGSIIIKHKKAPGQVTLKIIK